MRVGKRVKRLYDLEIDEVSLVDRPANQFGTVAFSKRAEDDMPELYDVDGEPVDESDLEHGETVFDADGNELLYVEEGTPEFDEIVGELEDDDYDDGDDGGVYDEADDYDGELVGVGKASTTAFRGVRGMRGARFGERAEDRAARRGRRAGEAVGRRVGTAAGTAYRRSGARRGVAAGSGAVNAAGARYRGSGVGGRHFAASERAFQAGQKNVKRGGRRTLLGGAQTHAANLGFRSYTNPGRYAAGAAGTAGAAGYAANRRRVNKSFGSEVYSELSKALSQADRDTAIAKALDVVDELAAQNAELYEVVGKMADERALEDFSELASEYGPLPVHPSRLGAIMKRAAETLPPEDVDILDRLFSSVGEQLYVEVGKSGTGESVEIVDQIEALAGELVSKSDLTPEQAFTAIMDANPEAYDEYLADTGQYR